MVLFKTKMCFPLTYLKIGFEALCNFKVVRFISKDKINSEVNEYIFIASLKFNSSVFRKCFYWIKRKKLSVNLIFF